MLVVLPFENLGAPEDEYFANGTTDAITARLAGVSGLGVISRQSAIQYRKTAKSDQTDRRGARRRLHPRRHGPARTARRSDEPGSCDPAAYSCRRRHAHVGRHVRRKHDGGLPGSVGYRREGGGRSWTSLSSSPSAGRSRKGPPRISPRTKRTCAGWKTISPWEAWTTWISPSSCFRKAVSLDPRFAEAWAGLSVAYAQLYWGYDRPGTLALEAEAAKRAEELAPDGPETHLRARIRQLCES